MFNVCNGKYEDNEARWPQCILHAILWRLLNKLLVSFAFVSDCGYSFIFQLSRVACGTFRILVPLSGIDPMLPAVEHGPPGKSPSVSDCEASFGCCMSSQRRCSVKGKCAALVWSSRACRQWGWSDLLLDVGQWLSLLGGLVWEVYLFTFSPGGKGKALQERSTLISINLCNQDLLYSTEDSVNI